jgi:hypothetical protein
MKIKRGITLRDIERKVGIGFVIAWLIGALLSLALTAGIIYVAIHFIAKFW